MLEVPAAFLSLFLCVNPLPQTEETGQLSSTEAMPGSKYGHAVAIDGETVLVSAIDRTKYVGRSGAVTVFNRYSTYFGEDLSLHNSNTIGSQFGYSLAIEDDLIVVGAPVFGGKGGVFVYRRTLTGWEKEQLLEASDLEQGDRFGHSVDIDNGVIVVGAPEKDDFGDSTGAAYTYMHNGNRWVEQAKLLSPSPAFDEQFGFAVAISEDYATIGAPFADDYGAESGATYTFRRNGSTWYLYATGYPDDPVAGGRFGYSVSADSVNVLVGSLGGDAANNQGAAYLFDLGSGHWDQVHKFSVAPGLADQSLGTAVEIRGNHALITAPETRAQRGVYFAFRMLAGQWGAPEQFISSTDQTGANFGNSIASDNGWVVTGSPFHDDGGSNRGAAFYFDMARLNLVPEVPVAGQTVDLEFSGGRPNDWAYLAASGHGLGFTRVPGVDVVLDLQFPEQLESRQLTDSSGATIWSRPVPLSLTGRTIWLQGFQFRRTTPVVEVTIQ